MNVHLGAMHAQSFEVDPKHLGFVLARYKFVAKMLTGYMRVLEIGCGDCTGAGVVAPVVGEWHGLDNKFTVNATGRKLNTHFHDIVERPFDAGELFDGAYMLDVLEHIKPDDEDKAIINIKRCLQPYGVLIVGMPSAESQVYASPLSKLHHVNCKTEDGLRATMKRHFENVFLLGMNDETLHTGYGPMCHYRLAIGCGVCQ